MPGYPGQMTAAQYGRWRAWHYSDGRRKSSALNGILTLMVMSAEGGFKRLRDADRHYAQASARYGRETTIWDAAQRLHRQYGKRTKHRW